MQPEDESDLEVSGDEMEDIFERKSTAALRGEVGEILSKIWEDPETLDVTITDLKFLKRG